MPVELPPTWSPAQAAGWRAFLTGRWTKDPPTVPGRYPVLDHAGEEAGFVNVGALPSGELRQLRASGFDRPPAAWGGYWWTAPLPELPPLRS